MLSRDVSGKHMRLVVPLEVHRWLRGQMVVLDEGSLQATVVRLLEALMERGVSEGVRKTPSVPSVHTSPEPVPEFVATGNEKPARIVGRKMVAQEPPREVAPFNPLPRTVAEVKVPQRDGWAPARDFSKVKQAGRKEKK